MLSLTCRDSVQREGVPVGSLAGRVFPGATGEDDCIPIYTLIWGVKVAFGSAVGRMPECRTTRAAKSPFFHSIWLDLTVLALSF